MHANPNPISDHQSINGTSYFIRALSLIHQNSSRLSHASRSRRIYRAAYASMAYSAGPRRAWRRALLSRMRTRAWFRSSRGGRRIRVLAMSRRIRVSQVEALRRIVPGGNSMDYCSLLEETADYVQCLSKQVILMKSLVDSVSMN